MSRFRVFVPSLWVTCVCAGLEYSQERHEVVTASARG
jgi:hypothetical protein